MKKALVFSGILISLFFFSAHPAFSQQNTANEPPAAAGTVTEPEMQWIWGEVVSIDAPNNTITVKYLDYESDTEKDIVITADDKTTYENAKSLSDIKQKDTVSVDYLGSPAGKNLAKNISVEKPEEIPAAGSEQISNPSGEKTEAAPDVPEENRGE